MVVGRVFVVRDSILTKNKPVPFPIRLQKAPTRFACEALLFSKNLPTTRRNAVGLRECDEKLHYQV